METFQDHVDAALALRQLRPASITKYRRLATHAGPLLQQPPDSITRSDVLECLADAREAGLSAKSQRDLLGFVRSILRDAGSSAADRIHIKVSEPDLHVLTEAQADSLRRVLESIQTTAADGLLVLLATGLRRGELLGLTGRDWRPEQRQLHVARAYDGPTKSGRVRYVDVPDWVAGRLDSAARDGGRLYQVSVDQLHRTLRAACQRAGVPPCRIHDLRHYRITRLMLAGVPAVYVCQQAGHHSVSFTLSTYGHLTVATPNQRRDWANR